ncbi:hypothetical protein [Novosphingobium sp. PASSN1]|uniref:hypothetical protein n=1 Tax=Novosphingobium sp. PASSN1 TaxID=2015561 RepID=UPI000BD913E5|nr:hypothetical protein [Novosphingobium sp. PASSN1]OYU33489.1 MAG: hypothetical protein CFE35_20145 [Novosphingobium sp. PASSN1]
MKINLPGLCCVLLIAPLLVVAGCTGSPPQPSPAPRGTAAPAPRPAPLPVPPRTAPPPPLPASAALPDTANWRDLPQTPGQWTYGAEATGSAVRFGQPGAGSLIVLRCDRTRPAIVLQRAGFGSAQVPATITTSAAVRRLTAAPVGDAGTVRNAAIPFEITFNVRDPLLDAMAFSRGRFMVEMGGAQTLVLPAWSELGRVIEDCR